MSIGVNEATRSAITSNALGATATALGLMAIFLLVTLLLEKEFYRAQGRNWKLIAPALDTVILPLMAAAGFILLYRTLEIIDIL
jgi:hypothetical protein